MLKVLGRILIILLAAALVAGATYAIVQNVEISLLGGRGEGGKDGQFAQGWMTVDDSTAQNLLDPPQGGRGQMLQGGEFRGKRGEGHNAGSVFGWIQVLKSLGMIALVTVAVVIVQKLNGRVRQSKILAVSAQPGG